MVSLQYYHSVLYSSSARKLSLEGFLQLFQFFLLAQAAYCREELFESCSYNAYLDFLRFLVYFCADAKAFRQAARVADFLNHYFPIPPLVLFSLRVFSFALCFSEINVMHLAICFFKFPIVAGFSGLVPALWLLFSFASFAFASFSFSSSSLVPKDLNCEIAFFVIFLPLFPFRFCLFPAFSRLPSLPLSFPWLLRARAFSLFLPLSFFLQRVLSRLFSPFFAFQRSFFPLLFLQSSLHLPFLQVFLFPQFPLFLFSLFLHFLGLFPLLFLSRSLFLLLLLFGLLPSFLQLFLL